MNLPTFGMRFQRMTAWPVMLNVNHRRSRSAGSGEEGFDSGQDSSPDFGWYQFHQPNLNVDDEQGVTRFFGDSFHLAILGPRQVLNSRPQLAPAALANEHRVPCGH